jgi:LacI family transcriptional regulator, galactose operon repressor
MPVIPGVTFEEGDNRRLFTDRPRGKTAAEASPTGLMAHPMKTRPQTPRIPQVALLLETSTEYGRGLLRGILRYSRLHGPWSLHVAPGHLDQALPNAKSWSGTGIIARIRSPGMEKVIRATRLPFVASSLRESPSAKAWNKFGEIRTDSESIARVGAAHLLEVGLRRFAYCGFTNCPWSSLREKAFFEFAKEGGYFFSAHHLTLANWMQRPNWIESWQHEQPIMVKWLRSLPKPVGLMACNDVCGREVLQACATAGLRVPDEVSVVGVDNDEMMCELANPALSSVALDIEKAGYDAAHLLDGLMHDQHAGGKIVWVRPTRVATRHSSDAIVQEDALVGAALQFIREHAKRSLSVSDIADELQVSRRTLERRFFRATDRTVLNEIMCCHLKRAKQILLETDLPCHQVAFESGFGSLKTFNRSFRRQERTTPQNFRRQSKIMALHPLNRSLKALPC